MKPSEEAETGIFLFTSDGRTSFLLSMRNAFSSPARGEMAARLCLSKKITISNRNTRSH